MARESCIQHPKSQNFTVIREHIVKMFDGDHCAAVLLCYFEHSTNEEIGHFIRQGTKGEPWVIATMANIYEETVGLYSIRRIQERIGWLVDAGFLREDQQSIGKTKRYLLNVEGLNVAIEKRYFYPKPDFHSIGQMSDTNIDPPSDASSVNPSDDPSDKTTENEAHIVLGSKTSDQRTQTILPPQPTTEEPIQNQSPTLDAEIDFDSPVEVLVKNLYRFTRGAKLENLRTKAANRPGGPVERLGELDASMGRANFDPALRAFLADQDDWLRTNHWPINAFLKNPSRWEDGRPQATISTGRTFVRTEPASTQAETVPAGHLPPEAETWNQVVTAGTAVDAWDWNRDEGRNLKRCQRDARFTVEAWRTVCEKVQAIRSNSKGDAFTFRWVIKSDENWWKVLTGEYDWMAAKPDAGFGAVKGGMEWINKYLPK